MIRIAAFLALADVRIMLKRRETILWAFVLPVVFFYFIGTINENMAGGSGRGDTLAVSKSANAGFLADVLIDRLTALGFHVVPADATEERRLTIPAGFTAALLDLRKVDLDFTRSGVGPAAEQDRTRIARAGNSLLVDLALLNRDRAALTAEDFARQAARPRTLTLDVKAAGTLRQLPRGFDQAVPGSMVFFMLIALLTSGAATLVIERNLGVLRRLACAPVPRLGVVLAKWGGRILLGSIQVAFCMITGTLLFHVHWGPHLPAVIAVLLAYAGFTAALGLLIGNVASTRSQAAAFGSITSNVLGAIGGCWWPLEIMPPAMQTIARLTPAGIAMDGLHKLMSFGAPTSAVAYHVIALTTGAAVVGLLAARWFRFQ